VNKEKNNENDEERQQVGIAVIINPRTFQEPYDGWNS
jgi:hypothetical protein